jgi:hypothetical protein
VIQVAAVALPHRHPDNIDATDGAVFAIAQIGDTIYIGGSFTQVGGQPRANLAAISASTGRVTPWNPGTNPVGTVYALEPGPGNTLYVGGMFGSIAGVSRTRAAQLRLDGTATSWAPTVNGRIDAFAVRGSRVYLGGRFTAVNGATRNRLAAVTADTGALVGWNPNADGFVWDIDIAAEGTVWVGGFFTVVAGQVRKGVVALHPDTGAAGSFRQQERVPAYDIVVTSNRVFIAGGGGGGRIIASDLQGNTVWQNRADGDMQAVDVAGGVVYMGGHQGFVHCSAHPCTDGVRQKFLVALNASTGQVLDWNPAPNGGKGPFEIIATGTHVLVGGNFTRIAGQDRKGFLRFTDQSTPMPPNAPSNLQVSDVTARSATARFGASSGAARYETEVRDVDSGSVLATTSSTTTSVGLTGLAADRTYDVLVTAVGADGLRSAPSQARFRTLPTAPTAPTSLTGRDGPGDGAVRLAWQPATGKIDGYRVRVGTVTTTTTQTTATVTGLVDGQRYTASVVAYGPGGDSPAVTVPVTPAKAPQPTAGVRASRAGHRTLAVSWDAVASTSAAPRRAYALFRNGKRIYRGTATSFEDVRRVAGNVLTYKVRTFGPGGASEFRSTQASAIARPKRVATITANKVGPKRVTLRWSKVASTASHPRTAYRIYNGNKIRWEGTQRGVTLWFKAGRHKPQVVAVGPAGESRRRGVWIRSGR